MFNLYFAGQGSTDADLYLRELDEHRLLSQTNEWKLIQQWTNSDHNNLFIDSGAFSVAHSGAVVDIDAYIERINNNPKIPVWAELDVIPYPVLNAAIAKETSEQSWKNYLYMRERITSPAHILPLYHFGEPTDGLRRILNTKINGKLVDYIGVGGRHGVSTAEQRKYFNNIFYIIQNSDNPNVKVHAFGMTVLDLLESFPFYSADSTSWLQYAISGQIITEAYGAVTISDRSKFDKKNILSNNTDAVEQVKLEIAKCGYDFEQLQQDYKARLRFNIDYFRRWAQNYQYKGPDVFKTNKLF